MNKEGIFGGLFKKKEKKSAHVCMCARKFVHVLEKAVKRDDAIKICLRLRLRVCVCAFGEGV